MAIYEKRVATAKEGEGHSKGKWMARQAGGQRGHPRRGE